MDSFVVVTEATIENYAHFAFSVRPDGMRETRPLSPEDAQMISRHLREHYSTFRHGFRDGVGHEIIENTNGSFTHCWAV